MTHLILVSLASASEVIVGSYGRVQASADLDGGQAEPVNVVAHGSRLEEDPYAELDLGWQMQTEDGARFRALVTPAIAGKLFHYDGEFDVDLAVRNLYAEARDFGVAGLGVWAGSRMYRGDDVYLLDFWPLDALNTVGGGVSWQYGPGEVAAHVGLNRLTGEDWQYQQRQQTLPGGVGGEWVTNLDRQRVVASLKARHTFTHVRPTLYGEWHTLPGGTRIDDDDLAEALPAETGWLAGAEVSVFGWVPESYVHVFYRHATGIAATGELTVPTDGFATDLSVKAAHEDLVALAGDHEGGLWSVSGGAYMRFWRDGDGEVSDPDDGSEWIVAVRPSVYPTSHFAIGVEASRQWAWREGLDPRTQVQEPASVTKLSLIPAIQPARGAFARPQVRLQYTASFLDEGALGFSPEDDDRKVRHFVGIGAEWWLDSQSYR